MKPNQLLWQLSTARRRDGAGGTLDDATLIAFRDGALSQEDQTLVEEQLGRSAAARARLAALAGVAPDAPPSSVRQRLLEGLDSQEPRPSNGGSNTHWRWQLAAAVVGVALLLPFLLRPGQGPSNTTAPWVGQSAFEVSVAALASSRAGAETGQSATAYADTRLTISIEALENAREGLDYAVFREDPTVGLIAVREGIEINRYRGAASVSAPASALLGTVPGTYGVWVVVAEAGAMPEATIPDGLSANAHLNGPRSRAYRLQMQLLPVQEP